MLISLSLLSLLRINYLLVPFGLESYPRKRFVCEALDFIWMIHFIIIIKACMHEKHYNNNRKLYKNINRIIRIR